MYNNILDKGTVWYYNRGGRKGKKKPKKQRNKRKRAKKVKKSDKKRRHYSQKNIVGTREIKEIIIQKTERGPWRKVRGFLS